MFDCSLILTCLATHLVVFFFSCILLVVFIFLVCAQDSLRIFCSAGLMVKNSFCFSLLQKGFIYPSSKNDQLCWLQSSLRVVFFLALNISFHAFLDFRESIEKSAIILVDLTLYVTSCFPFAVFNIFSMFCIFSISTIICLGVFLF